MDLEKIRKLSTAVLDFVPNPDKKPLVTFKDWLTSQLPQAAEELRAGVEDGTALPKKIGRTKQKRDLLHTAELFETGPSLAAELGRLKSEDVTPKTLDKKALSNGYKLIVHLIDSEKKILEGTVNTAANKGGVARIMQVKGLDEDTIKEQFTSMGQQTMERLQMLKTLNKSYMALLRELGIPLPKIGHSR